jgi:predicted nuclease of predicted toxin-antitoxin system
MKVLIDECAPRALSHFLKRHGHECLTVQEAGWAGKQNGDLLKLADAKFSALITLDTNIRYQQNLTGRKIAIVMLHARSNRLSELSPFFGACAEALQNIQPGDFVDVGKGDL